MQGRALTELIDTLARSLRQRGWPVSPEQIIDANHVVAALLPGHRGDVPVDVLRNSLAPIFCAEPAEQAAFYAHFADLVAATAASTRPVSESAQAASRVAGRSAPIVNRWRWTRRAAFALAFLVFAGIAVWMLVELLPPAAESPVEPHPTPEPVGSDSRPAASGPAATAGDVAFQPPPRPPAAVSLLRGDDSWIIAFGTWLIALIPVVIGLAILLRNIASRRVFLSTARTRSHPDIRTVPIRSARSGPFAYSRLASSITRLRQVRERRVRRLDSRRTVDATARAGGFPRLVYESRTERPGYVLLIERRNAFDFFAHASKSLADFLHGAGLEVYAYAFRGRPYRLTPLWRKGRQVSFHEIVQRYHGDALIVAGDPAMVRRGQVAGANHWHPDASAWSAMALLSSNACEAWNHEEDWYHAQNFAVASLGSAGVSEVAEWLAGSDDHAVEASFVWRPSLDRPYPRLLADDPERWLADEEDADAEKLLEQLAGYLGDDGSLLLAAIVAYPELRWPIARFLNEELFADSPDSAAAEARLLRVAQLPWCREGQMPRYLRDRLLRALDRDQRRAVQKAYYRLLNATQAPQAGGPAVEIADPGSKTLREFLRQLVSAAPPGPYRDYIFQSVLLDSPEATLGVEMDRRRASQVGRARWREAVPDLLRLARRTAFATAATAFVAFVWLGPTFTIAVEDLRRAENAAVTARILYWPESAAALPAGSTRPTRYLAERLRWALEARGFDVLTEELAPGAKQLASLTAQAAPSTAPARAGDPQPGRRLLPNVILYDDRAAVSMLDQSLVTEPTALQSWLATPMSAFVDVVAGQLDYATYSQPIEAVALDDAEALDALSRQLPSNVAALAGDAGITVALVEDTRSFQDRLRKGGLGPVMTLVPAGGFEPANAYDPDRQDTMIPRPFAIGKYEITRSEYARFLAATPDRDGDDPTAIAAVNDGDSGDGAMPVVRVTKSAALAYAGWLSRETGESYRLPTDAEWEYAARAGSPADEADSIDAGEGWFADTVPEAAAGPLLVGSLRANAWGLHDMQGNVAEWVGDCGGSDRASNCMNTTFRNGSWQDAAADTNLATRRDAERGAASDTIGFRVARELLAAPAERQPARTLTLDQGMTQKEIAAAESAQQEQ